MAYSICEPCVGTKDTACVDVCPVDCIHPRKDEDEFEAETMLYIHPEECIDCGACEPVCPVEAIYPEAFLPSDFKPFTEVNAGFFELTGLGTPGGAAGLEPSVEDHPLVTSWPESPSG